MGNALENRNQENTPATTAIGHRHRHTNY